MSRKKIVALTGLITDLDAHNRDVLAEVRAGNIVLAIGWHGAKGDVIGDHVNPAHRDALRKIKIEACDELLVCGQTPLEAAACPFTSADIGLATELGKPVRFLEHDPR